jgi:hypothetical protein
LFNQASTALSVLIVSYALQQRLTPFARMDGADVRPHDAVQLTVSPSVDSPPTRSSTAEATFAAAASANASASAPKLIDLEPLAVASLAGSESPSPNGNSSDRRDSDAVSRASASPSPSGHPSQSTESEATNIVPVSTPLTFEASPTRSPPLPATLPIHPLTSTASGNLTRKGIANRLKNLAFIAVDYNVMESAFLLASTAILLAGMVFVSRVRSF